MIFKGKQQAQILVSALLILSGIFTSALTASAPIETGAQQFSQYIWRLKGKRVMVIANQTSVVNGVHLIDTLLRLGIILPVFSHLNTALEEMLQTGNMFKIKSMLKLGYLFTRCMDKITSQPKHNWKTAMYWYLIFKMLGFDFIRI